MTKCLKVIAFYAAANSAVADLDTLNFTLLLVGGNDAVFYMVVGMLMVCRWRCKVDEEGRA